MDNKSISNHRKVASSSYPPRSSSDVHEPRNVEFMAFLGSFYAVRQSNDNNFGQIGSVSLIKWKVQVVILRYFQNDKKYIPNK